MSWSRALLRLALSIAVVGVALAHPVAARSASLPGPATLFTGVVDDPLFRDAPAAVAAPWLDRARRLGSTSVRISAQWIEIAPRHLTPGFQASDPGDPRYNWSALDASVRNVTAHGESVLLMVYSAPSWAEGPHRPGAIRPGTWFPSPRAFGDFGHAVALRYSGHFPDPLNAGRSLPRVSDFQAWNEPNLPTYLSPQWKRGPHKSWLPVSPGLYRPMLNAFYAAVKLVQPDSTVLAAGTAPFGDRPATAGGRMYPVTFLNGLFCLTATLRPQRCSDLPHLDGLDHHPYGIAPTIHAHLPGNVSVFDLGRITRILRAAERAHHVLPSAPKSLWITELDFATIAAVTPAIQARYLAQSFYELWSAGITHIYWFLLRDPPGQKNSFRAAGLYTIGGAPKLATTAFRFPFVALKGKKGNVTLWGRAPSAGSVVIEKRVGRVWKPILQLRTTAGGVFYARRRLGSHLQLRARMGAVASPGWVT